MRKNPEIYRGLGKKIKSQEKCEKFMILLKKFGNIFEQYGSIFKRLAMLHFLQLHVVIQ